MEKKKKNPSQLFIPISFLLLLFSALPSSSHYLTSFSSSSKTDAEALLLFKKSITQDPDGFLSNWQLNKSPCSWHGVNCTMGRVTKLDLSRCNLAGTLTFHPLSSLDMLIVLNLSVNRFSVNATESLLQLPAGLQTLDLSATGLVGTFPDGFIPKYTDIVYIHLSHNNLTGWLPDYLLANAGEKLQILDLSFNNFTGSIAGLKIGDNCKNLLDFDLSTNHLIDAIPYSLSNCTSLRSLNLSFNALTGEIPQTLGGLKSLQMLDLSHNHLSGEIPTELGNSCESLVQIKMSDNNISGSIPDSLSSCSSLQVLDLANNNISGLFPDSILENLGSLDKLLLSNNFISGSIPVSLSECKSLRVADFSSNKLTGVIPPDICPGATALEELRVPDNSISGEIPVQLSYCSNLKTIDLSINYLTGPIPPELGQLENLEQLMAWFNSLNGEIPPELGRCKMLRNLILNNNFLTGEIPVEIFNCTNLEWVSLTSNTITGKIPPDFGRLSRLAVLQLANNTLIGNIPRELGNCSSLVWLDLNSNNLSGEIPPRLGRQPGAKALNGILSGNTLAFFRNVGNSCKGVGGLLEFAGIRPERLLEIPSLKSCDFTRLYSGAALSDFSHYQTLEYLDLSYNDLRGKIPDEFGDMVVLQVLDIAHNKISGEIPWTLGQLRNLGVFDASHNRLQGRIPDSLTNLSFLVQIDLSYNELTGPIPSRGQLSTLPATQYAYNPGLCGVPLPPCGQDSDLSNPVAPVDEKTDGRSSTSTWANSIVLGILVSVASACILIVWAIAMRARKKEAARMLGTLQGANAPTTWKLGPGREKEALSINVATFQRQLRKLTFSQLIEATNGFSADSLIGCGGFGEVFRATLKDGSSVAIKKLIRLSCQGDREFMAEMETLGKIKHRNLVPLLGYCKVGEERLLVYEFMRFGSLEDMLHCKRKEGRILTWSERKKIARGAAKGLCFLHHNCIPHIIHRDMKSSNVLLDDDMEARVSDFGMARLISALDTHLSVSTLAGTPGYVPPEYYQSFRCTAKGDVYSFGVVMLELLTGKRPTDKDDFGDTNLVGWVKMKVREGSGREVIDPEMLLKAAEGEGGGDGGGEGEGEGEGGGEDEEEREMMKYLEITLQCVDDFPSRRPSMLQVVAMLRELTPAAAGAEDGNMG